MAEFAYNNIKNASISYTFFKLNCGYYFCVCYKEVINLCSKSKSANKLLTELQVLITVYWKNLYHVQKLQKQAYNKAAKPKSYASGNKFWLNKKYIKIK